MTNAPLDRGLEWNDAIWGPPLVRIHDFKFPIPMSCLVQSLQQASLNPHVTYHQVSLPFYSSRLGSASPDLSRVRGLQGHFDDAVVAFSDLKSIRLDSIECSAWLPARVTLAITTFLPRDHDFIRYTNSHCPILQALRSVGREFMGDFTTWSRAKYRSSSNSKPTGASKIHDLNSIRSAPVYCQSPQGLKYNTGQRSAVHVT